jgi:hypothetical protein
VVAKALGLHVRELRMEGEMSIPRYCAELYGIPEGAIVPGAGCMLDDDCLDHGVEQIEKVLVAMVAPSCIKTGDPAMDLYAYVETTIAIGYGETHGLDKARILNWAHDEVRLGEGAILDLADRLETEGVIEGVNL